MAKRQSSGLEKIGAARKRMGYEDCAAGFTKYEYAAKYGMSHQTAESQLRSMVQRGFLTKGYTYRPDGRGARRRVAVYASKKARGRKFA